VSYFKGLYAHLHSAVLGCDLLRHRCDTARRQDENIIPPGVPFGCVDSLGCRVNGDHLLPNVERKVVLRCVSLYRVQVEVGDVAVLKVVYSQLLSRGTLTCKADSVVGNCGLLAARWMKYRPAVSRVSSFSIKARVSQDVERAYQCRPCRGQRP
jgi:hypothetical protein